MTQPMVLKKPTNVIGPISLNWKRLCTNKSIITLNLLIILIISIPSQVCGANWIYICSSSNGIMFYFDSDSMRINKKDHFIKVWIKSKYLKNFKDKKRYDWPFLSDEQWNKLDHSIDLTMYNYTVETSLNVSSADYSYSGEVLYSSNSPGKLYHIIPGTIDEGIFDTVMEAAGIKK